jgi:hypothetical protein
LTAAIAVAARSPVPSIALNSTAAQLPIDTFATPAIYTTLTDVTPGSVTWQVVEVYEPCREGSAPENRKPRWMCLLPLRREAVETHKLSRRRLRAGEQKPPYLLLSQPNKAASAGRQQPEGAQCPHMLAATIWRRPHSSHHSPFAAKQ